MIRTTLIAALISLSASTALAQDHTLPTHQAGSALVFAGLQTRMLYAAVSDRTFDIDFTKRVSERLKEALSEAKSNIDRGSSLLPEAKMKHEDAYLKLREAVVQAERQLASFNTILERETASMLSDDEEVGEEAPVTDWDKIRLASAFLHADVASAQAKHAALTKTVRLAPLRAVRRATGERPE